MPTIVYCTDLTLANCSSIATGPLKNVVMPTSTIFNLLDESAPKGRQMSDLADVFYKTVKGKRS